MKRKQHIKASSFTAGFSALITALRKGGHVIETLEHGLPSDRTVEDIYHWAGGLASQGSILEAYALKAGDLITAPVMEWHYSSASSMEAELGSLDMTIESWAKAHGIKHVITFAEDWDQNGHDSRWYWVEV